MIVAVLARSEEFRTTVVCVDAWELGVPIGRFFSPAKPEGCPFHGVIQLLQEIEQALDAMDFPQSYTAIRTFAVPSGHALTERQTGKLATFAVRVLFRQNVTWQGSVSWFEGKREQPFRSALELILLIRNAMSDLTEI